MKKPDIAKRMARQSGVTRAEAADRLDQLVNEIRAGVRAGKETRFPGLGSFRAGVDGCVSFKREGGKGRG